MRRVSAQPDASGACQTRTGPEEADRRPPVGTSLDDDAANQRSPMDNDNATQRRRLAARSRARFMVCNTRESSEGRESLA